MNLAKASIFSNERSPRVFLYVTVVLGENCRPFRTSRLLAFTKFRTYPKAIQHCVYNFDAVSCVQV